jgi:hypothetical protein
VAVKEGAQNFQHVPAMLHMPMVSQQPDVQPWAMAQVHPVAQSESPLQS